MLIHAAKKTRLSLPNKNSLGIYTGYGGAAGFTRNSTETFVDFEGVSRTAKINEAAFKGARRVENLVNSNLTTWAKTSSIVTGGVQDPELGNTAYTITSTGVNSQTYLSPTSSGTVFRTSIYIRRRTGTGFVRLYRSSTDSTIISSDISSSWSRVSPPVNTTGTAYFSILIASPGDEVDVWHPQLEDVTGQANQNPSEYVSNGVKYFNYLNGNSVLNNVVTETKGAAISEATLKGVKIKTGAVQTIKTAQNINKYQGSLSFEFTPDANAVGTVALGGSKQDDNNYVEIIQTAGTGYLFRKCISGINYDAPLSGDFVAGTNYQAKIKWSSYSGTDIFINGIKGTNNPDTKPLPLGTVWYVGADRNGANQAGACFKNVLTKYK